MPADHVPVFYAESRGACVDKPAVPGDHPTAVSSGVKLSEAVVVCPSDREILDRCQIEPLGDHSGVFKSPAKLVEQTDRYIRYAVTVAERHRSCGKDNAERFDEFRRDIPFIDLRLLADAPVLKADDYISVDFAFPQTVFDVFLVRFFDGVLTGILTGILARFFARIIAGFFTRLLTRLFAGILTRLLTRLFAGILTRLLTRLLTRIFAGLLAGFLRHRNGAGSLLFSGAGGNDGASGADRGNGAVLDCHHFRIVADPIYIAV